MSINYAKAKRRAERQAAKVVQQEIKVAPPLPTTGVVPQEVVPPAPLKSTGNKIKSRIIVHGRTHYYEPPEYRDEKLRAPQIGVHENLQLRLEERARPR